MAIVLWITKTFQLLLYPLSLAILFIVIVVWRTRKQRSLERRLLLATLWLLYVSSLPLLANSLTLYLENAYTRLPISAYPSAPAIVVLGGTASAKILPITEPEEVMGSSRLLTAARLYKAGKAPTILLCGGGSYQSYDGSARTEADDMKEILVDMGVPEKVILMERESLSTLANAEGAAKILKLKPQEKILLVTSAFHMRRAALIFERFSIPLVPVPTSHTSGKAPFKLSDLFPTASALTTSSSAIKELLGYTIYSWF